MSLARTLVRNIASNWAGYGVHVVVGFFLTPFIVHALGETRYGIWTLVVGLTGYYGLLDLGVASGMTQYLTRYLAAKDIDNLNRSASTGFVALSCIGLFVFVGSLVVAFSAPSFFQIQAVSAIEVTWVLAITGTSVAMQFIFFTYSAVFTAVQRFDLSNAIGISTRLLSAVATVICLDLGYGLVGLSLVVAGTNLIDYLIRWRVARRLLPAMKISPRLANRESLREVVSFGVWNFVTAGSARLISYTDALVIAAFMPVAAVAPFAIAANLRSYFDEIFVRVGFVFFPAVTELDARGDQAGLRQVYLVSSKFMFLGSILFGSIGIFSAGDFFRLWVGHSYAEPTGYPSVATIFYLLLAGSMIAVSQRIGYQVLLGTRQVKLLAVLFAAEGLSNLVISLALVRSHGLLGVAAGTLIPAILFQGLLQPVCVCKFLQISLTSYCREVLLRPAVVLGALVLVIIFLGPIERSGDWASLAFNTSILLAVTMSLVFLLGLNKVERNGLVRRHAAVDETTTRDVTLNSRLRVGIIGCGAIAENSHLPALLSSSLVELVAVCDVSKARLSYIQRQFSLGKAIAALDYRQLFDVADAVVLTLPNHLHTPVGCEFLSRGIHVLCEKPLAATREECERLRESARDADSVLAVGYYTRFYPSTELTRQLIQSGFLGRLHSFDYEFGTAGSWETLSGYNLSRQHSGGGVLVVSGSHFLDRMLYLFDGVSVVNYADDSRGGVEANCVVTFECRVNGDVIEGRATLSKTRLLRNRLRIIGQRGALEIAEGQSHSVTFYPPEGRIKHDLSCLGIEDALKDKSVFQLELEDFVGAINAGKQPKVGAEESASMATIFENCYQIATALDEPWVDAAIPRLRAALPAEPTAASQPRS
jgi:predicted dehydrogenase/O-antigen/teichoic acid export membrane protein